MHILELEKLVPLFLPYTQLSPTFDWLFMESLLLGINLGSLTQEELDQVNETGDTTVMDSGEAHIFGVFSELEKGELTAHEVSLLAHEFAHAVSGDMGFNSDYEFERYAYTKQGEVVNELAAAGIEISEMMLPLSDEEIREIHSDEPFV